MKPEDVPEQKAAPGLLFPHQVELVRQMEARKKHFMPIMMPNNTTVISTSKTGKSPVDWHRVLYGPG